MELKKRIYTNEDLEKWIDSPSYNDLIKFVCQLQDSVTGLPNSTEVHMSPEVSKILEVLESIENAITNNPVVHEKDISRFGKVEFRDFYDQVEKDLPPLLEQKFDTKGKTDELVGYLSESFGNRTRIDYGSGHEVNFILFLFCLEKLQIITENSPALILQVFKKYISIMRHLQKTYWLEPAGSHGVWGLDDYHFLPFLFGASQLATHPHMRPKSIHNEELVEQFYKDYMYLECIHFINSIKTSTKEGEKLSLRWHSPMLDDISSAKSWMKIKEGMVKMFKAEVLGKLPIVQHIKFGSLFECPEGISDHTESVDDHDSCGHVHETVNTWGDCCGIKVPSAFAASEMTKIQKHIPFD
ncbi:serine/threonine-protein phosphatase 2A activator 2 [[Candida] anglica]|uniref:Serine/threonine-protein phosphatase 2A activator n=1 Tax=[Candida] anglica TaxID=148631 RepID=A0ABP0ENW8_9ASCO